jgi:hypothetical protein
MKTAIRALGFILEFHSIASKLLGATFVAGMMLIPQPGEAAPKKTGLTELTDKGRTLEAQYAAMLKDLETEIRAKLPTPDESKIAVWHQAAEAEKEPGKLAVQKSSTVAKLRNRHGDDHVEYLNMRLEYMPTMMAAAKARLEQAKAMPDGDPEKAEAVANAEKSIQDQQKQIDALPKEIEKAKADAEKMKQDLPRLVEEAAAAEAIYRKAQETTWKAMDALGAGDLLAGDALDGNLARFMVISEATPRGLAEFAQQSPEHEKHVTQLLNDTGLMIQMLVADGPNSGKFGEAMKIYSDIQKASPKAKEGVFQRLAVAVSLGHAVPIKQRGNTGGDSKEGDESVAVGNGSANTIDPVKRYLSYEKWFLDGELDPGFAGLDVWNMVMAVDGADSDETFAWGREMMNIMRSECIPRDGDTTRYVDVVAKEIAYTSQDVKDDRPEDQMMQNILANGGICGRQAFFGRFVLRAYGVPATARKQPGHATLAHWHPEGWKVRLGGDWGLGARGRHSFMNRTRSNQYGVDVNFLASSQAREDESNFLRVKRAQWIGAVAGEEPMPGLITPEVRQKAGNNNAKKPAVEEKPGFWSYLALHEQQRVIAHLPSGANKKAVAKPAETQAPVASGTITVDASGVINIPAAACSHPTQSTQAAYKSGFRDLLTFLKTTSGDPYLRLSRFATASDPFEYTFDVPSTGIYQLTAKVSTAKWDQVLTVSANGGGPVEFALPYTKGLWETTEPMKIQLKQGENVIKFHGPARVTIHHFTLSPLK